VVRISKRDLFAASCSNSHTSADDIEGWDSLTHVNLIVAVESGFSVKFSLKEMAGLRNVGDMIDLIVDKIRK
jgi:acyl carrier protein